MPFQPPSCPQPPLLLIVDDDPAVLDVTRSMARAIGCRALLADSAAQALELFRDDPHRLSAVVVDLHLPGTDGLQLVRRLREVRDDVHVVLMTGDELDDDVLITAGMAASAVLLKPFHPDDLAAAVFGSAGEAKAA